MKTSTKLKWLWSCLMLFIFNLAAFAQEKKIDVDINIGKGKEDVWYMNPVVWVIGGAVFILLLVALLRGKPRNG